MVDNKGNYDNYLIDDLLEDNQTKSGVVTINSENKSLDDSINDNKLMSSTINTNDYDRFNEEKTNALNILNKKNSILLKAKQELQGEIDGFNEQMINLLQLKECHKNPPSLNDIQIEKVIFEKTSNDEPVPEPVEASPPALGEKLSFRFSPRVRKWANKAKKNVKKNKTEYVRIDDKIYKKTVEEVFLTKPHKESPPHYFACLKCGSNKCNGEERIIAVYQFDEKNEIIDRNLEYSFDDDPGEAPTAIGAGHARENGKIDHKEVQFITSNYDECYTETEYLKNLADVEAKNPEEFLMNTYGRISPGKKYMLSDNAINLMVMDETIDNSDKINKFFKNPDNEYRLEPQKKMPPMRHFVLCAGKNHGGFKCGCAIHSNNSYQNFGISLETKSKCLNENLLKRVNNNKYKFQPIDNNKYEPKTIFFCTTCKHFFRYNCLRDVNQDKNTGKIFHMKKYNNDLNSIIETLPIINRDIIFRTPLFDLTYIEYLEKTARNLKITITNEILNNNRIKTNAQGLLGNLISDTKEETYDLTKDTLKEDLGKLGRSLIDSRISQKGGNFDIKESIFKNIDKIKLSLGNPYGKLTIKDNFDDFIKNLNKWKVHPNEDNYLLRLKNIKPSSYIINDNDKKAIRAKFKILQNDYISDFQSIFSSIKEYFPFLKEDFTVLESLKISGDNNNVYTNNKINIWNEDFTIMDDLNNILTNSEKRKINQPYSYLTYNEAKMIRTYKSEYMSNKTDIDKTILKLLGISFEKEKINVFNNRSDINRLFFILLYENIDNYGSGSPMTSFLTNYGDLRKISDRSSYSFPREINNIEIIIQGYIDSVSHEQPLPSNVVTIHILLSRQERQDLLDKKINRTTGYLRDDGGVVDVEVALIDAIKYYSLKFPFFEYTLNIRNIKREIERNTDHRWPREDLNQLKDLNKLKDIFGGPNGNVTNRIYLLKDGIGIRKFNTIKISLENIESFNKGLDELNQNYKKKKEEIDRELKINFNNPKLDINDPVYESLVSEMCGGNSGIFWYGDKSAKYKDKYSFKDYNFVRSYFSHIGIVYLPWYDKGYNLKLSSDKMILLSKDNLKQNSITLKYRGGNQVQRGGSETPQGPEPEPEPELESQSHSLTTFASRPSDFFSQKTSSDKHRRRSVAHTRDPQNDDNLSVSSLSENGKLVNLFKEPEYNKFNSYDIWDKYRKEVTTLFPLLYEGASVYQLFKPRIQESGQGGGFNKRGGARTPSTSRRKKREETISDHNCIAEGYFKITQIKSESNILNGSHSLDNSNIDNDNPIWIRPKNRNGNDIQSPIEILRLKQKIKDKCEKYYSIKLSIDRDREILKTYEKDYKQHLKKLDKEEKLKIKKEKAEIENEKNKLNLEKETRILENEKSQLKEREQREENKEQEEREREREKENELFNNQKDNKSLLSDNQANKLYSKENLDILNNELIELKNASKRKEEILKNLSNNIKYLKSKRHGEDSEERQIQQRDFEIKQKELILFNKLIEQREEKIKILKLIADKILDKGKNEIISSIRNNEIEKQQNYLELQKELNNITHKHNKDLDEYKNNIQVNEISELKNKFNNLDGNEINTQKDIVQTGGFRKKEDINDVLFKTVKKKESRTKKKNIKKQKKKEKSIKK